MNHSTHLYEAITESDFISAIDKAGGSAYFVGGLVRDQLLGRPIKDADLVVQGLELDTLIKIIKPFGRILPVGKSFGVIKFYPHNLKETELDIALPRTEKSTGTGHRDFEITSDPHLSIEHDLQRRDFTINAIAQNVITKEFIDPTQGLNDLERRTLRAVFDDTFKQDPLRLLRAVQFSARFELAIDESTFLQMKEDASLITTVSPERIASEIGKLLSASQPSFGFHIMRDCGLLPYVFPDIHEMIGVTQPSKNNEDVYTHTMKVLDASRSANELEKPGDIDIMLSALFHDAGKPKTKREDDKGAVSFFNHQHISTGIAWRWMKDYKISTLGANPHHVCHLVKHHMFETKPFENNDKALRRFINKVGKEYIFDLIDLRLADKKGGRFPNKVFGILNLRERIKAEINKKTPFGPKDLALNGHDIMNLGIKAGPILGQIQKYLVDITLEAPELNTKEILTEKIMSIKPLIDSNEWHYESPLDEDSDLAEEA